MVASNLHYGCTAANWHHVYYAAISVQGQNDQRFLDRCESNTQSKLQKQEVVNFNWLHIIHEVIDWYTYIHIQRSRWLDGDIFFQIIHHQSS